MSNPESQPRPPLSKGWPLRLVLYLAGLMVAGFVGVWIKAQTEKAGITIQVTSVTARAPNNEQLLSDKLERTMRGGAPAMPVSADAQLKRLTANNTWLESPNEDSRLDYVQSLLTLQEEANQVLQNMKSLRQRLEEWPNTYEGSQLETVYRIVREHRGFILGHIFGETRRGVVIFKEPKPSLDGLARRFSIETDNDGDYYVDSQKMRLPIIWTTRSHTKSQGLRLKEVAERIVNAIAYGIASDLQELKKSIDKAFQEEGNTVEVLGIVERELQLHSNWHVTATIANNGKDTIALDPRTMLYLNTKDKRYVDSERKEQKLDANRRVGLTAVTEDKRQVSIERGNLELSSIRITTSPILVKGGEAVTVAFRSIDSIGQTPEGERLLSLFKSEGCRCLIAVLPLTQSKLDIGKRGPILSSEGKFREVKFDMLFADELTDWSRR